MIESYPLQWPQGYPRTKRPKSSQFQVSMAVARDDLLDELKRMRARNVIISSNVRTYERGGVQIPYANQGQPDDAGVAVYFEWSGEQHVIACDKWKKVEENVRAIGLTTAALRGLERWGATEILKRTFSGLKALPEKGSGRPWWIVLEVDHNAAPQDVRAAYRRAAHDTHPDKGGSALAFQEVQDAWQQAQAAMESIQTTRERI